MRSASVMSLPFPFTVEQCSPLIPVQGVRSRRPGRGVSGVRRQGQRAEAVHAHFVLLVAHTAQGVEHRGIGKRSNSFHSAARSSAGRVKTIGANFSAQTRGKITLVAIDVTQELADFRGRGHGRPMYHLVSFQRAAKICHGILPHLSDDDGIAENLPDDLKDAAGVSWWPLSSSGLTTARMSMGARRVTGTLPIAGNT